MEAMMDMCQAALVAREKGYELIIADMEVQHSKQLDKVEEDSCTKGVLFAAALQSLADRRTKEVEGRLVKQDQDAAACQAQLQQSIGELQGRMAMLEQERTIAIRDAAAERLQRLELTK
jgi:hypothetical protein